MKPTAPHVEKMLAYCREVVDGKILACRWVKAACQRHLSDLVKAEAGDSLFAFDPVKAERVCKFMELLPHVKGKWSRRDPLKPKGNRMTLEPWQCFVVCSIFGWTVRATRLRRFQLATVFVPRKNGKSFLSAAIGWWMFAKDGEPGAEVYCGAGSERQAWEVFGIALQFPKAEPRLASELGVTVNAKTLIQQTGFSMSKFEPVIGKPGDGASPHCAIIDEYHEHPTSEQYDTFKTGMGAREQPLLLTISTAGLNIAGPCRDHWDRCEKLLAGTIDDERHFAVIYTIDDPEKWQTDDALKTANPNWGVSVLPDSILPDRDRALREARDQGAFRTKHLNCWVTANAAYFNIEQWKKLKVDGLTREGRTGARCIIAGDLSSKVDLVAITHVFPQPDGKIAIFARYYLPEATAHRTENQHYRKWSIEGWLTLTPGNIVDLGRVRDEILEDCKRFDVPEVPLDPFQATLLINELRGDGVNAYEFRQTVMNMSEPMKQVDALIRSGRIQHDGNPITAWCISNVVAHLDAKENVYPRKEKPELKIDGAVSLIMGVGRAMLQPQSASPGVAFLSL